ncbi:MAG: alpha/beta fold hydrolase [Betaproteobacteria bacterium]|nr:MAG: alpha/beta fold hydrolase [Betaproteobacteria bacterium]
MRSERMDFVGAQGQRLSGCLDLPEGPVQAYALFAHCFTGIENSAAAVRVARALTSKGIAVLRFDCTGFGQSEGSARDLVAAAHALAERHAAPGLLVGHSLGGAAALAAASELPDVTAIATIGAPFDAAHVTPPRRALLVLHAPGDKTVSIDNAAAIFQAARHPKSFVSLDDADHLLTRPADAEYAAEVIAAWASRYLVPVQALRHAADEGRVVVEETGEGDFPVEIHAGGARFLADEPVEVGGLGSGPTPYDLLSAGLGACTAMTLRMYARRKGWRLGRARVCVGHARSAGASPSDAFIRDIALEGELSDEQKARLIEIAGRCPVHLTLERGARVETRAVGELGSMPGVENADQHACDMQLGATP